MKYIPIRKESFHNGDIDKNKSLAGITISLYSINAIIKNCDRNSSSASYRLHLTGEYDSKLSECIENLCDINEDVFLDLMKDENLKLLQLNDFVWIQPSSNTVSFKIIDDVPAWIGDKCRYGIYLIFDVLSCCTVHLSASKSQTIYHFYETLQEAEAEVKRIVDLINAAEKADRAESTIRLSGLMNEPLPEVPQSND